MRKVHSRQLWCELTFDEQIERGQALAKLCGRIGDEQTRQANEKKRMKETLDGLEADRRELTAVVRDKKEMRDVECVATMDPARGLVEVHRTDTGELIETRRMTDEERQRGLFARVRALRRGRCRACLRRCWIRRGQGRWPFSPQDT